MKNKILCSVLLAAILCTAGCNGGEKESSTTSEAVTTAATTSSAAETTKQTEDIPVLMPTVEATVEQPDFTEESQEIIVPETAETTEAPDIYAPLVAQYDNSYLGLPQKDKVYIFKSTGTTAAIGDTVCHGVSCHDEYEGQLYYMCDFFVTEDGGSVYRFYESTGEYVLLPEKEFFPPLDPTIQSTEQIFTNADSLYNAALGAGLTLDMNDVIAIGDVTYYRVTDERFTSVIDTVTKLNTYFTQEIINALMDSGRLREGENGGLYAAPAEMSESVSEITYDLTVLNGDYAEFTAYITSPAAEDGAEPTYEEYVFKMEQQFGVWRFTNYRVIS